MVAFSWILLIGVAGGVIALIDGVIRLRGRRVFSIVEIIVAALFLISLYVPVIPLGSLVLGVLAGLVLLLQMVFRGGTKSLGLVSGLGLALIVVWVVLSQGWVIVPVLN